jgi:hypothetical protein
LKIALRVRARVGLPPKVASDAHGCWRPRIYPTPLCASPDARTFSRTGSGATRALRRSGSVGPARLDALLAVKRSALASRPCGARSVFRELHRSPSEVPALMREGCAHWYNPGTLRAPRGPEQRL